MTLDVLQGGPLWRLSLVPDARDWLHEMVAMDWGGGVRWLVTEDNPREQLASEGHCTLFRPAPGGTDSELRFSSLDNVSYRIATELKRVLDPHSLFNPGRHHGGF